ncbi:MAG: high-potential iron-sulfur protein [Candidatus Eremiobacteraeota bacterium]|nr:high-potential iron-sulfur protein [Candidatus Eremiobacteraeota bacterium]
MKNPKGLSRREFVGTAAIVLPALAGLLAVSTTSANAAGSKDQFHYQSTPKDGHQCSGCTFFIAGKSKDADGTCKIVSGDISPKGWCQAWSAKS